MFVLLSYLFLRQFFIGIFAFKVWEEMTSNDYQPQTMKFSLHHIMLNCRCICTGGDTNVCDVMLDGFQHATAPLLKYVSL